MKSLSKSELRALVKRQRRHITSKQKSHLDAQIVRLLSSFLASQPHLKQVFTYSPLPSEPNISQLVELLPQLIYGLPVIRSRDSNMEYYRWSLEEVLKPNSFKVLEPSPKFQLEPDNSTLMLVPVLGVNPAGYRLGYGAGYYDRYLSKHPHLQTIGVCYQQFTKLEFKPESHDLRLNYLATETSIIQLPDHIPGM